MEALETAIGRPVLTSNEVLLLATPRTDK